MIHSKKSKSSQCTSNGTRRSHYLMKKTLKNLVTLSFSAQHEPASHSNPLQPLEFCRNMKNNKPQNKKHNEWIKLAPAIIWGQNWPIYRREGVLSVKDGRIAYTYTTRIMRPHSMAVRLHHHLILNQLGGFLTALNHTPWVFIVIVPTLALGVFLKGK